MCKASAGLTVRDWAVEPIIVASWELKPWRCAESLPERKRSQRKLSTGLFIDLHVWLLTWSQKAFGHKELVKWNSAVEGSAWAKRMQEQSWLFAQVPELAAFVVDLRSTTVIWYSILRVNQCPTGQKEPGPDEYPNWFGSNLGSWLGLEFTLLSKARKICL